MKKAEEMMKEADRKYIQIKKIMREQYKKMEDNANKKKKLDEKQKNIDLIVNSKLKNKLSIEIIKLDKKYKIWLILLLIYGIGLTITEIKKNRELKRDIYEVFLKITDKLSMFISFIKKTINLAKTVVKSIDNEAVSEVIYWVILLVIVIVCSVALRTIVNYCMKVIRNYIKPKLCDRYSAIMFLITITVFVNFSRQIKRLINVNLILIEGIIMSAYGAIRLFFTSKDIRRRNTLLIYIIGVIGVISLIHILIKY